MQTHIKIKIFSFTSLLLLLLIHVHSMAQEIWGMTKFGGDYNKGVIFKMDEDATNQEVVFSFEKMGLPEGKMTEYTEGVFYGMTSSGWDPSNGIIYRFESATGGFTKIIDFDGANTGKDGPGSLILASNGMFYGMTATGGAFDKGVLFEFNPATETYTKKVDFNGYEKGSEPLGSLMEGSDGRLYGMTSMGGKFDAGTIFTYDLTAGSFMKLFNFDGGKYGSNPMGSLIEAADGFLYGMTRWGGAYDKGVIFQFDRLNRKVDVKVDFDGEQTGRNPHGSLTQASNGKLYGMTPFGGEYNRGVIFEFDPDSVNFLVNHNFRFCQSYGSLTEAPDKNLYGVINNSVDTAALLFSFDPETKLLNELGTFPKELRDYYGSMESLTLNSDGNFFFWGRDVFYIEEEVFLFEFDFEQKKITDYYSNSSFSTGSYPFGKLVQTSGDSLFGFTGRGGKFDKGVVFMFNPGSGTFKKIVDFDGIRLGAFPAGNLLLAMNSKLYGMTSYGGAADEGVLFELEPSTGDYKKMFDFDGTNTGGHPNGNLVQASNGKLYGMTIEGGENNNGVLFEFDPVSGAFNKLIDFDQSENGYYPQRTLIHTGNGTLYGITKYGGASNSGMFFRFETDAGVLTKIADCTNRPVAIMQASNNNLYLSGYRTVFEYNPDNKIYHELEILPTMGFIGELLEVSEGVLWGMDFGQIAYQSGTEDRGSIFEINLNSNESAEIVAFNGSNGRHPENSGLIKLKGNNVPVANCNDAIIYLDENGQATLLPDAIDDASSGEGIKLSVDKSLFSCEDVGDNNVTLSVTDQNKNTATCRAVVSVKDTFPPEAACRSIDLFLDASGNAFVEAANIDKDSNDACGIKEMTLSENSFSCENLGENIVEFTVTDASGNNSGCFATINVKDTIAPFISGLSSGSRYLEPYEHFYRIVKDSEWNAEATDNCGVQSFTCLIKGGEDNFEGPFPDEYQMKAGLYTIEWEATDNSGNRSFFTSTINIEKRPVTLLLLEKATDQEKEEVHVKVKFSDELLIQGIKGKKLDFSVSEYSVEAVTDENGIATAAIPLKELTASNNDLTVSFEEDDTYTSGYTEFGIITGTNLSSKANVSVYPNPFSEKLFIEFVAQESTNARIDMFDASGRLVKTIFHNQVVAGMHYKVEFTPRDVPANMYLYRLQNGSMLFQGKVVFRK